MTMKVDGKNSGKRKRCEHLPRPWKNKQFVIDIEEPKHRVLLIKEIEKLGGTICEHFDESIIPACIVSDYHRIDNLEESQFKNFTKKQTQGLPLILRTAVDRNIRIQSYSLFMKNISSLKKRFKTNNQSNKAPFKNKNGIRMIKAPFFKLEQFDERYAPDIKEFLTPTNFPTLYFGANSGKSVFHHVIKEDFKMKKKEQEPKSIEVSQEYEIHKANLRRNGLCDVCTKHYNDIRMHCTSKEHLRLVSQPGFYDEVDELCFFSSTYINQNDMYTYINPKQSNVTHTSIPDFFLESIKPRIFKPDLSIEI